MIVPRPGFVRTALVFAALIGSLTLVVWRQSRTLDTLRELDAVRRALSLVEAERAEQSRRIQVLEGRARMVDVAGARLGMRVPRGDEIVILPLESGSFAELLALGDDDPAPEGATR